MGVPHFQPNPLPKCNDWPLAAEESRAEETLLLCETFRVASRRGKAAGTASLFWGNSWTQLTQLTQEMAQEMAQMAESWGTWIWALGAKAGVEEVRTVRRVSMAGLAGRFADLSPSVHGIFIDIWWYLTIEIWGSRFHIPRAGNSLLRLETMRDQIPSDDARASHVVWIANHFEPQPFVTASFWPVMFERSYLQISGNTGLLEDGARTQFPELRCCGEQSSSINFCRKVFLPWTMDRQCDLMVCQSYLMVLMEVLLNQMPSQVYSIYIYYVYIVLKKDNHDMCYNTYIYIYNFSKLPGGFEVASIQRNVGGDRIVRISVKLRLFLHRSWVGFCVGSIQCIGRRCRREHVQNVQKITLFFFSRRQYEPPIRSCQFEAMLPKFSGTFTKKHMGFTWFH